MHAPTRSNPGRHPAQPLIDLALSMVVPIRVIKRGWRTMGVGFAYLVHLYGILVGFIGISLVDAVFSGYPFIQDMFEEAGRMEPDEALIFFASFFVTALLFESGFVVLAWIVMPWGASPEPWRRSMNRGLIRLLQLTPFFAISLVVLVLAMYFIDENTSYSYTRYRHGSVQSGGFIERDFGQFLQAVCWLVYVPSQLIVLLWAASVHTATPTWAAATPWPASCEGCGYPLVMLQRGGSCPECGTDIEASIDTPRNRPDHRSVLQRMAAATLRPYSFGKSIPLYRPDPGYRTAACVGIGLLAATAPIGMVILFTVTTIAGREFNLQLEDLVDNYDQFAAMLTVTTCITLVVGTLIGLLSAAALGTYARMVQGRYALYAAAQAFAYQSAYLAFWALGTYPLIAINLIGWDRYYQSTNFQHGYYAPPVWLQLLPFVFPLYFLAMATTGYILQARLMSGAKHGNG